MLIEYVVFGALVGLALVATIVGIRRRRADGLTGEPAAIFPHIGDGSAGTEGTHHIGHAGLDGSIDGVGGSQGGGFDGGGGSHGGDGFDGGGGQHH